MDLVGLLQLWSLECADANRKSVLINAKINGGKQNDRLNHIRGSGYSGPLFLLIQMTMFTQGHPCVNDPS